MFSNLSLLLRTKKPVRDILKCLDTTILDLILSNDDAMIAAGFL